MFHKSRFQGTYPITSQSALSHFPSPPKWRYLSYDQDSGPQQCSSEAPGVQEMGRGSHTMKIKLVPVQSLADQMGDGSGSQAQEHWLWGVPCPMVSIPGGGATYGSTRWSWTFRSALWCGSRFLGSWGLLIVPWAQISWSECGLPLSSRYLSWVDSNMNTNTGSRDGTQKRKHFLNVI